jgi:hypothetical protein
VNERHVPSTALSAGDRARPEDLPRPAEGGPRPAAVAPSPEAVPRPWRWTAGRITALVIGALLVLVSLGLLGAGGTALWADRTQRDAAGYLTTGVHEFSAPGSALVTERIAFDAPGVGWLYSSTLLGKVRIRITPVNSGSPLFVGIGPSANVDRYLAGVGHTLISDFWSESVQPIAGGVPGSPPGTQDFWVASASGAGAQTLTWDPANGSWTVVVMHADGRAGIDVGTDLAATYPALLGIAVGLLLAGGVLLLGGVLLIVGVIRRSRERDEEPVRLLSTTEEVMASIHETRDQP